MPAGDKHSWNCSCCVGITAVITSSATVVPAFCFEVCTYYFHTHCLWREASLTVGLSAPCTWSHSRFVRIVWFWSWLQEGVTLKPCPSSSKAGHLPRGLSHWAVGITVQGSHAISSRCVWGCVPLGDTEDIGPHLLHFMNLTHWALENSSWLAFTWFPSPFCPFCHDTKYLWVLPLYADP